MTAPQTHRERDRGRLGRRVGYLVAIIVNVALLVLVNEWPGWQSLGFLTADAASVVSWINASIALGITVNVVYLVSDRPLERALGETLTTAAAAAVLGKALAVFPFDFAGAAIDWAPWLRALLWFLVVVTGIGLLVNVTRLLRLLLVGSR